MGLAASGPQHRGGAPAYGARTHRRGASTRGTRPQQGGTTPRGRRGAPHRTGHQRGRGAPLQAQHTDAIHSFPCVVSLVQWCPPPPLVGEGGTTPTSIHTNKIQERGREDHFKFNTWMRLTPRTISFAPQFDGGPSFCARVVSRAVLWKATSQQLHSTGS